MIKEKKNSIDTKYSFLGLCEPIIPLTKQF